MSNKNVELITAARGKFEVNLNDDTGVPGIYKALDNDTNPVETNVDDGSQVDAGPSKDISERRIDFSLQKIGGKKKSVNFTDPVTENTLKSSKKKGKKKKGKGKKKSASEKETKDEAVCNTISDPATVMNAHDDGREVIESNIERPTYSKEEQGKMDISEATAGYDQNCILEEDLKADADLVLITNERIDYQVNVSGQTQIKDNADMTLYTNTVTFTQEIEVNCEVIEEVEKTIILSSSETQLEDTSDKEKSTTALLEEITQTINAFSELQEEEEQTNLQINNIEIEEEISVEILKQKRFDIPTFEKIEEPQPSCVNRCGNVESPIKTVHFEVDMDNDMSCENSEMLNMAESEIDINLTHDVSVRNQSDEDSKETEKPDEDTRNSDESSSSSSSSSSEDEKEEKVKNKKMKKRKRRSLLSGIHFHFPKFGNKKKKITPGSGTLPSGKSNAVDSNQINIDESKHISGEVDGELSIQPPATHETHRNSDEWTALSCEVDAKGQTDVNVAVTGGTCDVNIPSVEGCMDIPCSENVDNFKQADSKVNDLTVADNIDINGECAASKSKEDILLGVETPSQTGIPETKIELQDGMEISGEQTSHMQLNHGVSLKTSLNDDKEHGGKRRAKKKKRGILASLGIHISGRKKGQNVVEAEKTGNNEVDPGLDGNALTVDAGFQVDLDSDTINMDTNKSDAEKLLESGSLLTKYEEDQPHSMNLSIETDHDHACDVEIELSPDLDDRVDIVDDDWDDLEPIEPVIGIKNGVEIEFMKDEGTELTNSQCILKHGIEVCDENTKHNTSNLEGEEINCGTFSVDVGISRNKEDDFKEDHNALGKDYVGDNLKNSINLDAKMSTDLEAEGTNNITKAVNDDATLDFDAEAITMDGTNIHLDGLQCAEVDVIGKRSTTSSSSSSEDEVLKVSKGRKRKKKKSKKKTKKNKGIFGIGFSRQISSGKKDSDLALPVLSPDIEARLEADSDIFTSQEIPRKAQLILGTDRIGTHTLKTTSDSPEQLPSSNLTSNADVKDVNKEKIVHIQFARSIGNRNENLKSVQFDVDKNDVKTNNSEDLPIEINKDTSEEITSIERENNTDDKKKKGFFSNFHMPSFGGKTKKDIDLEGPSFKANIDESIDSVNVLVDANLDLNITEKKLTDGSNQDIDINEDMDISKENIDTVLLDDDKEFTDDRYRPALATEDEKKRLFGNFNINLSSKRKQLKDKSFSDDSSSDNIEADTEVSPESSFEVPEVPMMSVDYDISKEGEGTISISPVPPLDCDPKSTSIEIDAQQKLTVEKHSHLEIDGKVQDLDKDVDESLSLEDRSNRKVELNLGSISDDNIEENNANSLKSEKKKKRFSGFNIHLPHLGGKKKTDKIETSTRSPTDITIDADIKGPSVDDTMPSGVDEINAGTTGELVVKTGEIDGLNIDSGDIDIDSDMAVSSSVTVDPLLNLSIDVSTKESPESDRDSDRGEQSPKPKKRKGLFGNGIQFPKFGGKKHGSIKLFENKDLEDDDDTIHQCQIGDGGTAIESMGDDTDIDVQGSGNISPSLDVELVLPEAKLEEGPEFESDIQPKELECIPEEIDLKLENDSSSNSSSSSSDDEVSEHENDEIKKEKKKGFFGGINVHLPSFSWKRNKGSVDIDSTPSVPPDKCINIEIDPVTEQIEDTGKIEGTLDASIEADIDADIDIVDLKMDIDPDGLVELDTVKDKTNREELNLKSDFESGMNISCETGVVEAPNQKDVTEKEEHTKKSKKKKGILSNIHFPRFGEKRKKGSLNIDSTEVTPDTDITVEAMVSADLNLDGKIEMEVDTDPIMASAESPDFHLNKQESDIRTPDVSQNIEIKLEKNISTDISIGIEGELLEGYEKEDMDIEVGFDNKKNDIIGLTPDIQLPLDISDTYGCENKELPDTGSIEICTPNTNSQMKTEDVPKVEDVDVTISLLDSGSIVINGDSPCGIAKVPELNNGISVEISIEQPGQITIDPDIDENVPDFDNNLNLEVNGNVCADIDDTQKFETSALLSLNTEQKNLDPNINVDNTISLDNKLDSNIELCGGSNVGGMILGEVNDHPVINEIASELPSMQLKTNIGGDVHDEVQLEMDLPNIEQETDFGDESKRGYIPLSDKSATLPQTKLDLKPASQRVSIEGSVKMRLRKGSSEPDLSSAKSKKKKKRFTLPSFNFHFPHFWSRKNKTMTEEDIDVDGANLRRPKSMEVLSSSANVGIEPQPLSLSLPIGKSGEESTLPTSLSIDKKSSGNVPDGDGSLQGTNMECERADDNNLDESTVSIGGKKTKFKKKTKKPSFTFQFSKHNSKTNKISQKDVDKQLHDGLEQKPIIPDDKLNVDDKADISDITLNTSFALELPSDTLEISIEDSDAIDVRPQIEGSERCNLDSIQTDMPEPENVEVIIEDAHKPLKLNISEIDGGTTDVNKDLPSPAFTASDSGLSSGVCEGDVNITGFGTSRELSVNAGIEVDVSADVSAMETSCSSQADEDIKSCSSNPSLVEKHKKKGMLSPLRLPKISFSGKRKSRTLPAVVTPSGTVKVHNNSLSSDDSDPRLNKGKKKKEPKGSKKKQLDKSYLDSNVNTDEHLELSGNISFDLDIGASTSTPLKSVHRNNSNACEQESPVDLTEESEILPVEYTTTYKVVVAIDFGSTFSGYAYCFPINPEQLFVMRKWQSGDPGVHSAKMPSTLLLTPEGEFHSFGYVARDFYHDMEHKDAQKWLYFDKFKMTLHANQNLDLDTEIEAGNGINVPAIKLFELALAFFRDRALQDVFDRSDHQVDQQDIRWVLTVPAIWKQQAKQFMRKAAYLAGIGSSSNPDQLTIALEPEAASIYIRQLEKKEFVPEKNIRRSIIQEENKNASLYDIPENICEGCRYIVVDCGGGTVDITVHQVEDQRGLVEVHRASGGTFGSISVDRQFQQLLVKIYGQDFIDEFKIKRPAGWVDLMIAFEARKRNVNPWKCNPLNVSLPFSFIDYYKKFTKTSTVEQALKVYDSEDVKWSPQGMMRFTLEGMQSLFKPSITSIIECIDQVLNQPNIGDISHLFIVGGFAESPLVQKTLRKHFQQHLQVVIPPDVTMAVVKGAVMYGMDPTVIRVRKSKLTYGVGVLNRFDPQKHPLKKKVVKDKMEWCLDIFDKLVEVDQAIQTGEKVCRSYTPAKPNQSEILISIYCSEKKNAKFITDTGVKKFGTLKIDLSTIEQLNDWQRREIRLTMQYGDTEIKISALDVLTGHCVKANLDFDI